MSNDKPLGDSTSRRHGVVADRHVVLSRFGIRRRLHADFEQDEAEALLPIVVEAASALAEPTEPSEAELESISPQ
jgi:uncharacterized metal-binding protein